MSFIIVIHSFRFQTYSSSDQVVTYEEQRLKKTWHVCRLALSILFEYHTHQTSSACLNPVCCNYKACLGCTFRCNEDTRTILCKPRIFVVSNVVRHIARHYINIAVYRISQDFVEGFLNNVVGFSFLTWNTSS